MWDFDIQYHDLFENNMVVYAVCTRVVAKPSQHKKKFSSYDFFSFRFYFLLLKKKIIFYNMVELVVLD